MSPEKLRKMQQIVSTLPRRRYAVIWANRGYYPEIVKFNTRLDAVKFALQRFKSGFDFIRIDAPKL